MRSTDVLIVGAGPVGLIMAHQLGKRGVTCLQIEAEADLSDEPRAVGLDPETLRSLQSLELLENLGLPARLWHAACGDQRICDLPARSW